MLSELAIDPQNSTLRDSAKEFESIEKFIWENADLILYPSRDEADYVNSYALERNININVKAIPVYSFTSFQDDIPGFDQRNNVIFVAGFGHPPNIDAANWFVENVWGDVLSDAPGTKLYLVGSNPTDSVLALASNTIIVTGYVSDNELINYYLSTKVAIAPLRFGGGMKGKVVEAIVYGIPLVTTHIGIQGLSGASDIVKVTSSPGMMAKYIVNLLKDKENWDQQSNAQKMYARKNFSRRCMAEAFDGIL